MADFNIKRRILIIGFLMAAQMLKATISMVVPPMEVSS